MTSCKRNAVDDMNERQSRIIAREIRRHEDGGLFCDVLEVCQSMYRERRKRQPRLPTNRNEIRDALQTFRLFSNDGGKNMIQHNDAETGLIVLFY